MMKINGSNLLKFCTAAFIISLIWACAIPEMTGRPAPTEVPVAEPLTPRELFLEKCSRCHETSVAYQFINQREKWIKVVAGMATRDFNWINGAQMKNIISYYDDHPAIAAELFNRKCASCHQSGDLRQLDKTNAQWKTMITFMGGRSSGGMTQDETAIIFLFLTE